MEALDFAVGAWPVRLGRDVPDPTLDENLELPSGRGLMLMRTFMSFVEYNEKGNQVRMEKKKTVAETAVE